MKKKKNLREGKKTAVTEEDIPTPKTENLRYVGPVTRMRARYAGDDWKREVDLSTDPTRPAYAGHDSKPSTNQLMSFWSLIRVRSIRLTVFYGCIYIINAAGTNKSAAAGSTSLNTKRLHKDTEDLAFNAAGTNKSTAAGSTSLNIRKLYKDTEDLAFNAAGTNKSADDCRVVFKGKRPDPERGWQSSSYPPRPPPPQADDSWICYRVSTLREDAKEEHNKDGLVMIKEDDYDFEYVWKKRRDPSDTFKIGTKKLSKAALEMRRMRFQMPWRPY